MSAFSSAATRREGNPCVEPHDALDAAPHMPPKNAAPAAAPAPAASAPESPALSDYVRDAVREKAARDWQKLRARTEAFGAIEGLLGALATTERELATAAPIVLAAAPEVGLGSKIKKLRKAVDEAGALSRDVVEALGGAKSRASLEEARAAILDALRSAGLDESALDAPAPAPAAPPPAPEETPEPPAVGEAQPSAD